MGHHEERWREALTPLDTREIWDWLSEEGELPAVYAVSGRLDVSTCPMAKGPWRALRNPIVRNVVAMAGVQCIKTLIGEGWLLWSIANDPGSTQWLQPDDEEAKEHAEERFLPLMEKFPVVHKFYTADRHQRKKNFIRFQHMFLRIEGANNPGNLQRKSIKNQMRSEIWQKDKWVPGRLKEADSRLTQFVHNSKTFTESQPGWDHVYGEDDMHGAYLAGNQQEWQFCCLSCGKRQPYLWDFRRHDGTRAGMRWDKTERTFKEHSHGGGEWRWGELLQTVRYECIHCGHRHHDDPITRRRMTANSDYVALAPEADPATESFTWNQLAMPTLSWFETKIGGVKNFLLAHEQARRGFDKALKDFWMKVVAQPFDPAKHSAVGDMETVEIRSPDEPAEKGPQIIVYDGVEFIHRFGGIDVQSDHFWALADFWSAKGDSLSMDFQQLYTWEDVAQWQQRWGIADQNLLVDVSHRTDEVKDQCIQHGHAGAQGQWLCWKAMRGSDQDEFSFRPKVGADKGKTLLLPYTHPPEYVAPYATLPMSDPRRARLRGRKCQLVTWSNPTVKDIVINRRDGHLKGCVSLVARGPWNREFNRQMHSQRKDHVDTKFGGGKWKWVKKWDDHGLDCKCMTTVRALQGKLIGA